MSEKIKTPELLAPAGNLQCALAAFESGADAVYAGLLKFNAREKSDNFSLADMSRLSSYAKKHKKKVYLTLNTLIKEHELEDIYAELLEISRLNLDAVIVQDIGIVRLLRDFFPEINIHASTQMGIHNSAGIRQAASMGISRVILERQVTIDELSVMAASSPLEIEVFIHGALCCSLSGNCLFSSWIGGWSGNRGKCKQPCRRRYHSKSGENGFFFSTNDLYTLDLLPTLREIGISSLKIEGRLKKADYVSRSVAAYRMMLNADKGEEHEILGKAKNILAGSPGRKWSSGFYTEESLKTVVQYTSTGISGALCGEVSDINKNGFTVQVSRELKTGDRIRIQPRSAEEGPGITITAMEKNGRRIDRAKKNDLITIISDREVRKKSLVYKVGELPKEISVKIDEIPELTPVTTINLNISLTGKGLSINFRDFPDTPAWERTLAVEKAENQGIQQETIAQIFKATRNKHISAGRIIVHVEEKLFLPAGALKRIRRDFWEWVSNNLNTAFTEDKSSRNIDHFVQVHFSTHRIAGKNEKKNLQNTYMVTKENAVPSSDSTAGITAMSIFRYSGKSREVILPVFTGEKDLKDLEQRISEAYSRGIRRFRVRSLYQIDMLRQYKDIYITASYPLPVSNSFTARELQSFGVNLVQGWVELEKQALYELIDYSPLPVEIYRLGRPHILATRAEIYVKGEITDSHGVEFIVKKDKNEKMTFIYGKKAMELPSVDNAANCFDLTEASLRETDTTNFNFSREWV